MQFLATMSFNPFALPPSLPPSHPPTPQRRASARARQEEREADENHRFSGAYTHGSRRAPQQRQVLLEVLLCG